MNKLMIAASAALCATVGFSDVTSANIVGYQNVGFEESALNYKACPFVNIGDGKVRLSDLKVTGYEGKFNNGNFCIRMLSSSGATPKISGIRKEYYWVDTLTKQGWQDGDEEWLNGDSVLGDADEIFFNSGDGIVIYVRAGYTNCKLVCNGEVVTGQTLKTMPQSALNYLGNPLARPVALSELSVEGYEGKFNNGNFCIRMLSSSGATPKISGIRKEYYWVDTLTKQGWQDGDEEWLNGDSVLGDADEIFFKPGDGVTVYVRAGYTNCKLRFPSLVGAQ